jgi:hypothetical protein
MWMGTERNTQKAKTKNRDKTSTKEENQHICGVPTRRTKWSHTRLRENTLTPRRNRTTTNEGDNNTRQSWSFDS